MNNIVIPSIKIITAQIIGFVLFNLNKNRNIWIIGEKKTEARDNGFHFFKYMREKHKEIEAYYVISKGSSDLPKVESIGEVIEYNSFKHCVYYFYAKERVCSQLHGVMPYENIPCLRRLFFWKRPKQHQTHLKHGIAKDLLDAYDFRQNSYDLLICGAIPEYNYYKSKFSYPDKNIALTGLCRFDALNQDNKPYDYILIMPTFRSWLRTKDSSKTNASEEETKKFEKSDYFKVYNEVLHNECFINKLKQQNLKVVFYLHYTMQPYVNSFKSEVCDDTIIIADRYLYDVQNLLKHARLLITDYSSVFSDFAYLKRPVLYFQFDEKEYRTKHYKEGYFNYKRDGFGPVCSSIDELTSECVRIIDNKFAIDVNYKHRFEKYFAFFDSNNCERVFNSILKLD